jgi:hypothetical protein
VNLTGTLAHVDFTTKERIKLQLNIGDDRSQDVVLDQMIASVSGQFVHYMGLHGLRGSKTEVYEGRQHKKVLSLDAKPVTAFTSLKHSSQNLADWSTVSAVAATNYSVSWAGGWVRLMFDVPNEPNFYEVQYTGGLANSTASMINDFPDLTHACDMQVQYLMSRQKKLGGDIQLKDGAGTQYGSQYRLLREVQDILDQHRRATI